MHLPCEDVMRSWGAVGHHVEGRARPHSIDVVELEAPSEDALVRRRMPGEIGEFFLDSANCGGPPRRKREVGHPTLQHVRALE